jgi:hypothetical protein
MQPGAMDKTEGIRLGKLRRKETDHLFCNKINATPMVDRRGGRIKLWVKVAPGYGIKWCQEDEYIVSLGAPIGWTYSLKAFWNSKYVKCKTLMARWRDRRDVDRMSLSGSPMLANSMVLSSFRYWVYTSAEDKKVTEAVASDTQALIYGERTSSLTLC